MSPNEKTSSTNVLKNKLKTEETQEDALKENNLLEHPSYIELQEKLTKAEEKAEKANEYWEKILRQQAEMENILRRSERDVSNAHKFALEKFAIELLPVIDNLERAVKASEEAQTSEGVFEGVHLTLKLFRSVMDKFGIVEVNPEKQPFNPEFHQAISTQQNKDIKPGTVITVMQKGYLLNGRLIRPALVVVSAA